MSVLKRRFPRHLQEFIFSMWKWNVNNESYISNVLYECIMRELVNANGIRLKNEMRFCFFFSFVTEILERTRRIRGRHAFFCVLVTTDTEIEGIN